MDASQLYRLPPEEFTAARDVAAKARRADGDREGAAALKALRRPSVAAWLVNLLAQDSPALLGQLLDLGPALAQAQTGRDATALRELGAQRRSLVDAVTDTAADAAGRPVSAAVREEVAATLEAALADPASAEAVRSGRLVRALSYAGFGDVDLSDAVAPQGPGAELSTSGADRGRTASAGKTRRKPDEDAQRAARQRQERAARIADAEATAHAAAGRLDDAVAACEQADRDRVAAAQAADERAAHVDRLTEELARARAERDAAAQVARAASATADQALARVRRAQDAADAARSVLDRLRRGG